MSRPTIDPATFVTASEGWDALLRNVISALAVTPLPVPQFANLAAFPAAGSYDRCLATAIDTNKLYLSQAGAWKEVTVAP